MNLSIVIKCSDDERIWRCIQSVDAEVEIIASITPNRKIEDRLNRLKIKYAVVPKGNLALTANAGYALTTKEKVIIMDSDSYFERGTIQKINKALDSHPIVKPLIRFVNDGSIIGKLISKERDLANRTAPVAYVPGLGVRKDAINKVGGFIFNNYVRWAEDAELTWRIKKGGIPIFNLDGAVVFHDQITLFHELKSAFYTGAGKRLSVKFADRIPDEDLINVLKRWFDVNYIYKVTKSTYKNGLGVFLFCSVWNILYALGYHVEKYTEMFTPDQKLMRVIK